MVSEKWWNRLTFWTRIFWTILPQFSKTLKTLRYSGLSNRRREVWNLCWILWCNSLAFVWKQGEKLILQESVWIHNIFSGLCLRNYYIWVYLRFELNNLLHLGVNFVYKLWFYWAHGTDLQLLNRSSCCEYRSTTEQIYKLVTSHRYTFTGICELIPIYITLLMFEAFMTQIRWILMLFFNTWK